MQPKRKQGICSTTNPVPQRRISSFYEPMSSDTNCRQSCNFATFKGHQPEDTTSKRDVKYQHDGLKDASGNIFQIVPLDDVYQGSIKPLNINIDLQQPPESPMAPKEPFKFAGYLGAIVASVIASLSVLCLKLLPVEDTLQEKAKACMGRGIFMILFCAIAVVYQGHSFKIPKGEYMVNILRAVLGALSILLFYGSVMYITLGEASALVCSSPIWTCVLSYFILKEPLPISLFLTIPAFLLGIILLAQPDLIIDARNEIAAEFELPTTANHSATLADLQTSSLQKLKNSTLSNLIDHQLDGSATLEDVETSLTEIYLEHRWPGIALAMSTSVFLSVIIVILKFRKKTPIATCSFYMGVAMSIMPCLVQMVIGFGAFPASYLEWSLHFGVGFFSATCQYCFQWSLQFVPAGSYSVARSLDIVIGFALGAIFLNEAVLWTSVLGSVLIMIVVVTLILNDYVESAIKSMFFCCRRQSDEKHQVKPTKE